MCKNSSVLAEDGFPKQKRCPEQRTPLATCPTYLHTFPAFDPIFQKKIKSRDEEIYPVRAHFWKEIKSEYFWPKQFQRDWGADVHKGLSWTQHDMPSQFGFGSFATRFNLSISVATKVEQQWKKVFCLSCAFLWRLHPPSLPTNQTSSRHATIPEPCLDLFPSFLLSILPKPSLSRTFFCQYRGSFYFFLILFFCRYHRGQLWLKHSCVWKVCPINISNSK